MFESSGSDEGMASHTTAIKPETLNPYTKLYN